MDTPDEWVSRFEDVSPTAVEDFNVTDDQVAKIKERRFNLQHFVAYIR